MHTFITTAALLSIVCSWLSSRASKDRRFESSGQFLLLAIILTALAIVGFVLEILP